MEYKKGFKVKPKKIDSVGLVTFTDGTNDGLPNQQECEAYGYKYNSAEGTCRAFDFSSELAGLVKDTTTTIKGTNNKTERGVYDTLITGKDITAKGSNRNVFATGEAHEIQKGVNNATVLGKYAKSTHDGEVVIGANSFNFSTGEMQYSIVQLSNQTAGNDKTLYIQGNTTDQNEINIPANSITMYEVIVQGLTTGGSAGTLGHWNNHKFVGSILSNGDGELTHTANSDGTIGSSGSTGTPSVVFDTNYIFGIHAAGVTNVNADWHAVVKLYTLRSNRITI